MWQRQSFTRLLPPEKPAQRSRTVLSKARYIKQGDLANARHARKVPGTESGRKRKAGNSQKEPEAKQTKQGQQETRNSNSDDSGLEMQAEKIVRMQEEQILCKSIMYRMQHQGSRRERHLLRPREIYVGGLGFEVM